MVSRILRSPGVLVFGVAALIMFADLGGAKLWDRDEPRNAGCAREMLERGDWVVPIFNDELRHQKPVLLYWVMLAAYEVFGISEWSARCGSALFAIGTCLWTYAIGRRLFSPQVGLLAGIVLATSIMFTVAGRAATPDSLLIFFQTAALGVYVLASPGFRRDRRAPLVAERDFFPRQTGYVALFYALLGLGVLAKGAIAVAMPSLIIGLHLLYVRSAAVALPPAANVYKRTLQRWCAMFHPWHVAKSIGVVRPVLGTAIVLAIAAPWFVAVGQRTGGDFPRLFFWQEHFGRAAQAFENHRGGWWYYPLAISLGFFPWSVFLIPTLWGVARQLRQDPVRAAAISLLVLWVACQIGVFSLVATKLPSYVTPCYPALALLVAAGLFATGTVESWAPASWYRWAMVGLGLSGLGLLVAAIILIGKFLPGRYGLLLVGGIWMEAALLGYLLFRGDRPRWAVQLLSGSAVVAAVLVFGVLARQVSAQRQLEGTLAQVSAQLGNPPLATYRCLESSWIYYAQGPIWELAESSAGAAKSLEREAPWQPKPRVEPADFIAACPNAVLITTDVHWAELEQKLPKRYRVIRNVKYFPRDKSVLIAVPEELVGTVNPSRVARWKNAGTYAY